MAALADEATSDWYTARKRAAAGQTPVLGPPTEGAWRKAWALSAQRKRPRTTTKAWPDLS